MWSIRVLQVDGKEVEIRRDVCFMDGKCQILFSTVGKEKAALDDDQLSHVLFGLMNDEAIKSFTVEKCHSDFNCQKQHFSKTLYFTGESVVSPYRDKN